MTPSQRARCWCCRAVLAGPHWQIVTPSGFVQRYCRACAAHIHLNAGGGIDTPDPCPERPGAPWLRPVP